jgi:hypothetical protein
LCVGSEIGNSNLDYQNANSPDPTYFRKLPSYYSSMYGKDEGNIQVLLDNENAEKSRLQFLANPQIDWNSCIRPTKIR